MTDPRMKAALCLAFNLIVFVDHLETAVLLKVGVVTAAIAWGRRRQGLLLIGAVADGAVAAAITVLTVAFQTSIEVSLSIYLRWTVVMWAGLILVGGIGIEDFLRVLFWLRLPRVFVLPIGFAIRSIPIVQEEMSMVRRSHIALRLLDSRHPGLGHSFRLVESALLRSISRIDRMVSQLERRGFSPEIFGSLGPPALDRTTIPIGIATLALILLVVVDRVF